MNIALRKSNKLVILN